MNNLAKKINEVSRNNGFWDGVHAFSDSHIKHVAEECKEALSAYYNCNYFALQGINLKYITVENFESTVKNTLEDELADIIILVLDVAGKLKIDIQKHVELKVEYNKTRGYLHGKEDKKY